MFYDVLTTAAICDELKQEIEGGWVQKVLHLSEHALGMEIYANQARKWLLISAHPQHARVNLVPEKLARDSDEVSPLLLLLRKHVRDSRLAEVSQPPLERLLILTFERRRPQGESSGRFRVIIEIMGRHSNVSLVDEDGLIVDCLRRVPTGINRHRVVLPRHPYVFPPPQNKISPERLGAAELRAAAQAAGPEKRLWQVLVGAVAGMSPLLAREIVHRASGEALATADQAVVHAEALIAQVAVLYASLRDHQWSPSVAREEGVIIAFAPYPLSHVGQAESAAGMSEAVDAYFGDLRRFTAGEQAKEPMRRHLGSLRERHLKRKEALMRSLERGAEAERLRRSGEAILASVVAIVPGQQRMEFGGENIELDGTLKPAENAQAYFRSYKKAKAALAQVPEMLAGEEAALAYLEEVSVHLELADTPEDVRNVSRDLTRLDQRQQKLAEERKADGKKSKKTPKKAAPARDKQRPVLVGGFEIYVGHSARQNEEITFHMAAPDDLWLHARKTPGAHVVVRAGGREVPPGVLQKAAVLAATYSQARDSARVAVDCTARKHVRRIPQGLPGLVTYTGEKTVFVEVDQPLPGPS